MFNYINLFLSMLMFMSGIVVYVLKRKHLLSTLLSLEFIVLSLFYLLFLMYMNYNYEYYFTMIFLVFSVCEGALGLSILVSMIRTHGNDYFQSFNVLEC
uniref:NADH-ubiquinone oxidoreductase chain 4L n=1 Tax=Chrysoperla nipponensis TaxID=413239 RepID=E6N2M1_CHRNP|nr:NADH dehydrogenase subunit 4L [Chrysoperla nipponensis]AJW60218.1 NADH dehydrogenase subunit 4L [Chrysoperla nipponensis]ARO47928.1 NADH dehydrogenase subunit 4L [Chrysoperla nipponensis]BAJ61130.1 NADH dehydrogenase subunit 4L [Chrysoperla nipponensis]